jgi:hypothetical protein
MKPTPTIIPAAPETRGVLVFAYRDGTVQHFHVPIIAWSVDVWSTSGEHCSSALPVIPGDWSLENGAIVGVLSPSGEIIYGDGIFFSIEAFIDEVKETAAMKAKVAVKKAKVAA